jgi:hypothetical protein
MLHNAINDGANGVTECPIAPGSQKTYTFLAEQYGTSWYPHILFLKFLNGLQYFQVPLSFWLPVRKRSCWVDAN